MKTKLSILASLCLVLAGCDSTTPDPVTETETGRCEGTEYLAFDPVNHAPQDQRLLAFDQMLAAFDRAADAPATAAAEAASVLARYEDPSTKLAAKAAGRIDVHFPDAQAGAELDAAFRGGIDMLAAATSAHEVSLAKQQFEKAGVYRFLYLSVLEELYAPTKQHYDEAFGYLGTGATNVPGGRKGLAAVATRRDGTNGTTLAEELFELIREGSCAIEKALNAKGADSMELGEDADYDRVVDGIDRKLQLVFAYSIGHELVEIGRNRTSPETALLKVFEADGYFVAVEDLLLAGNDSQKAFATSLRAALDEALGAVDAAWIADFDADGLLSALEAAYGIKVKG
ncbi:hypothetical protein [Vulgatibacter incomptus]|uniref:Lipoprotein n=1 Tax=Vulgatibacter incomptus TaxID=1391653 RepID=A0A0K1PD94_9BACT|nr:hypothetical protein [Vulgatibacter incomptus]AKU91089.1 hypothetical protein AKJ08_1476 [Vulgatibacter incomptus]